MARGVTAVATSVERDSRAFFTLSMQAMEGSDPLRPSALRALLTLDDQGPATVGQLSERLALSQSATSRLVDRLVQQGFVDREPDSHDRRQLTVGATSDGRAVVARLIRRRRAAVQNILARMSAVDLAALEQGMGAFAAAARPTVADVLERTARRSDRSTLSALDAPDEARSESDAERRGTT